MNPESSSADEVPPGGAELGAAFPESSAARRIRFRRDQTESAPETAQRDEQVRKLDEVRLSIGDRVQLEKRGDGSRYFVQLIGYRRGASVVVSTPLEGEQILFFREGQDFVVRLFAGRGVFAFTSTVLRAVNNPFPHLHLAYPAEVRGFVLRETERARVRLITSASGKHGGPVAGTIDDLSPGGARLIARTALGGRGDVLQVKCRLAINGREDLLSVKAIVRTVTERRDDVEAAFEHGLQFVELSPIQRTQLEAFVYRQLLDDGSTS